MTKNANGWVSGQMSSGSVTVASGVALLIAIFAPVEENMKPILVGALQPIVAYLLPAKMPYKK